MSQQITSARIHQHALKSNTVNSMVFFYSFININVFMINTLMFITTTSFPWAAVVHMAAGTEDPAGSGLVSQTLNVLMKRWQQNSSERNSFAWEVKGLCTDWRKRPAKSRE